MASFTILYLYYNNPEAIRYLETVGVQESPVPIVVVDDGSDEPLTLDWKNATVVRIERNVPWNMSAANNFGLGFIETDVVVRLDIDHFFETRDLALLAELAEGIGQSVVYLFPRRSVGSDGPLHPAPNLFMTRTETLRRVGGYDERFCGHYGYEDVELHKRLRKAGVKFVTLDAPDCHRKGSLMTKGLDRATERNKALFDDILAGRIDSWRKISR